MNRNHLKTLLKINGLTEASPDDEIRAVLLHSKYSEEEISSALVIIRQSEDLPDVKSFGLHKVMYTNNTLRANEVVSLLGVDFNADLPISLRSRHARIETLDGLLIIGFSILVAAAGIILYMFFYKVGFFYPS